MTPDVPIQLSATFLAVPYTLWTGYADTWKATWAGPAGIGARSQLTAVDLAGAFLQYAMVNVTASTSRRTDQAIAAIMVAAGLSASDYSLDTGKQSMPMHFVRSQKALDAIMDVVYSEMGGVAWMSADGKLRFEARDSRLGTTADATWGDSTNVIPGAISYELDTTDLISTASVVATIFTTGQADNEVFRWTRGAATRPTADSIAILAGQYYEAETDYGVPVVALTAAAATNDYTGNSAIDGTGTDKTSALTVTFTDLGAGVRVKVANADAGTVYVTKLRGRGQPVSFAGQTPRFTVSKSVSGMKADRSVELRVPFADDSQATRDYAYGVARTYRYPYPRLALDFAWSHDDITAAMLAADIGQLIQFADATSGNAAWLTNVNDLWYVEAIEHTLVSIGMNRTRVTLVPAYLYRNLDAIAYDAFTRSNVTGDLGTSTSGDVWASDGNMDIATNAARANSDTLQMPTLDLGVGKTNAVIEVSLAAIGAGDEVGVVFRHADANNQYRFYVDKGSNEAILEKNVASVMTELSSPAYTVGTTAEVKVVNQGTRIRCYVGGRLYIDTTDSALTAGTKVGLFARNANATATFEDFYGEGL